MTVSLTDVGPWSYSSIKTFDQCPKKYYHLKVAKDVRDSPGEAALYGTMVHEAAENYIKHGEPIPDKFEKLKPIVETLAAAPGKKHAEIKLGVKRDEEGAYLAAPFFGSDTWYRGVCDLLVVNGDRALMVDYKGLPLDTPIATPQGFTTMGEVRVGDLVFSSDGKAYPVTAKSPVHIRPCFRVEFDDKTSVECDNVHLWKLDNGDVVPVTELVPRKSRIPLTDALHYAEAELPIDPYVLGLWLADGTRGDGSITKPDEFIWDEIGRRGYTIGEDISGGNRCPTRTVYGMRGGLRALGVLYDKYIPDSYLQASATQRVDLLRGLMDGDGSANPVRKQVVFTNTSTKLASDVKRLVESLGFRCNMSWHNYAGFGVSGVAHFISWRPRGLNPFLLPRKADRVGDWGDGWSATRRVMAVVPTEEKQTQCISVASPDNTYLCTKSFVVTHNTGKSARYADTKQLDLMAGAVFVANPEIQKIKSSLIFVVSGEFVKKTHIAERKEEYLSVFDKELMRLGAAMDNDVWNAKPSGLCPWCPVKSCEHWSEKRR